MCSKYHRNNRHTTLDQNGFMPIGRRIFPGSDSSYLSVEEEEDEEDPVN